MHAAPHMVTIYSLKEDAAMVARIQKATLTTKDFGLEPTHGLFGSPEWWGHIGEGTLPVIRLRGTISAVVMTGMGGDWPLFTLRTDTGDESSWTREANNAQHFDLYAPGKRVEVDYVIQKFRGKTVASVAEAKLPIEIRVDAAPLPD